MVNATPRRVTAGRTHIAQTLQSLESSMAKAPSARHGNGNTTLGHDTHQHPCNVAAETEHTSTARLWSLTGAHYRHDTVLEAFV